MTQQPYTVLIVDDEAPLRRVLERLLSRQGYRVVSAGSAETAYELLATAQANALLLGIQLPTTSGMALYLAIVHPCPALDGSIAIMTGDADAEELRHWLARHHCPVMRKPFNLKEVSDWLATVIEFQERRRAQGGAQA